MIDLSTLIKTTGAYRTVAGDKASERISHAYLILSSDGENLGEYLKLIASLIACEKGNGCGECRTCKLIKSGAFSDVIFYPKKGAATVTTDDVNELIEESYLRPIESNKKIFIINHAEAMNAVAQNKILKTLEEPPEGVHIIMGATNEHALLSTVKSRMKKLEITSFTKDTLFNALSTECEDKVKLSTAIACGDGTVGGVMKLYGDKKFEQTTNLALDVIVDMKSSKDVLEYSFRISKEVDEIGEFLSVLNLLLRDLLVINEGEENLAFNSGAVERLTQSERFNRGAITHALEAVTEAQKRKRSNANATMLIEWLLFQILEGKYKWQKL